MKQKYTKVKPCKFFYVFIVLLICSLQLQATIIYSNGNGNWTSASSWLRNGIPDLPACGDTIIIQAGHIITQNAQMDYTACSTLDVIVEGTLQFTNGNKLKLPCNSFVEVRPGGLVKKATAGGGNST